MGTEGMGASRRGAVGAPSAASNATAGDILNFNGHTYTASQSRTIAVLWGNS